MYSVLSGFHKKICQQILAVLPNINSLFELSYVDRKIDTTKPITTLLQLFILNTKEIETGIEE
jgi:hypothetical protein